MEEAFSALDPLIRTDMLLELQDELHKTIVFFTYDWDEAHKLEDHFVVLKDGAMVKQGEPPESAKIWEINVFRRFNEGSVFP